MPNPHRRFPWRADIEPWRWLILGSLGALASHCGGKAGVDDEFEPPNGAGNGGASALGGTGGVGGRLGYGGGTAASGGYAGSSSCPFGTAGPCGGGSPWLPCTAPTTSLGGGWERCANGMIHRASSGTCASELPRPSPAVDAGSGASVDGGIDAGAASGSDPLPPNTGECRDDRDCTARPHGHCETFFDAVESYCQYGCVRDEECGPGYACLCGSPVGQCVLAACSTDGDCAGRLCANYTQSPGCGGIAFTCQSPLDQCTSDETCPSGQFCALSGLDGSGGRKCQLPSCVIGRPFLIDGAECMAPCIERCDWYSNGEARATPPGGLDPELRGALREGWTAQALMEHASVAAFARFALQLASLGAPPELLTRTATAMLDEIRHARACFELARRYSEREIGPGPLPVAGALQASDFASVMTDTILEGCIGETLAAIEAAEALSHCEDPAASRVLERIVAEESQHAELAWQFLAWALRVGPAGLREQARAVFRRELERPAIAVAANARDQQLLRHGLMSSELRQALRARVLREVIAPCVETLFEPNGLGATRHPATPECARRALALPASPLDRA